MSGTWRTRAPHGMRAHEVEGISIALIRTPIWDRDNCFQKFAAMGPQFVCELVIDGIPIFGTFLLKKLKCVPPDLAASPAQSGDDPGSQRVHLEALMPLADERGSAQSATPL